MGEQRMNTFHSHPLNYRSTIMKRNIITLLLTLIVTLGFSHSLLADVLQVRATALPTQITSAQTSRISVQWQVFANGATASADSFTGQIINPLDNSVLLTAAGALNASGGNPLTASEFITIADTDLKAWMDAGLKRVLYKRNFTDAASGSNKSGAATISLANTSSVLSRELSAELIIQRLSLHFNDLQRYAVVETHSLLNATLTVEYRGQGVLNGRWQWAFDDGSEDKLQYRTLQLVQQNLPASQRYELRSPALAVERPGRYRVRFCLSTDTPNTCAEPAVEASYQVMDDAVASVQHLDKVMPQGGTVSADSQFSWPVVKGGVVYQLQLFVLRPGSQPEFVTGMWLPKASSQAQLSKLVRSKLKPGAQYVWRMEVFGENGQLLARSNDVQVVWQP